MTIFEYCYAFMFFGMSCALIAVAIFIAALAWDMYLEK